MVKNEKQHIEKTRAKQGFPADSPEPYKIAPSTPFDFGAKNLTPYGGLFPVSTMLEKLGFKELIEETLTIHRIPRVDRKSTRLNSSHSQISYAVFCLKKKQNLGNALKD